MTQEQIAALLTEVLPDAEVVHVENCITISVTVKSQGWGGTRSQHLRVYFNPDGSPCPVDHSVNGISGQVGADDLEAEALLLSKYASALRRVDAVLATIDTIEVG